METKQASVTMKGKPLTLVGTQLETGDKAPDFEVVANNMSKVQFSSFEQKVRIICSVPSLDTSVCDAMTRRFNEAAGTMGSDAAILTISMDLPFAQKRWCGSAGIENVTTLSDYRNADFGTKYGLLIKELRLLARAVLVVDSDGTIRYKELVGEISSEPDYEAALQAARELL